MSMKGLGCLDDPEAAFGCWTLQDIHDAGALGMAPKRIDWTSYVLDLVYDQGSTNACVGHATANSIALCRRVHYSQPKFERPSALHIYDLARGKDRIDNGTTLFAAAEASWLTGYLFEHERPWSLQDVFDDKRAQWGQAHIAMTRAGLRHHRVLGSRRPTISSLVAAGYGVAIGMDVGPIFQDLKRDQVYHGEAVRQGGHAMSIVGYDEQCVKLLNSWGRDHSSDGFCYVSWAYIESDKTRSVWAYDQLPDSWRTL
jgi:C1A family cysteine protease